MNNFDPASAGAMTAAIDHDLVMEFSNLLYEHMSPNLTHPWMVEFDDLAEVIGDRYTYRVLRRRQFDPDPDGLWFKPRSTYDPTPCKEVNVKALAPALRRAIKALDPLGLCRPYIVGAEL
ncbi:hypothetical protein [Tabrizicola sp.]|uniref:hypothetical protein n=1 Tax=Tabrizicola sp. TaxID=2005166 RepID=UPI002FDD7C22